MDLSQPVADLWPGARGRLLRTLVTLEVPVSVRALARHAEVSPQAALAVVNDLAEAGLVLIERAGAASMVALNREHLAAGPLLELVQMRVRLVRALSEELGRWDGLAGAWLYGSAARGDGDRSSDVDLFLVGRLDAAAWLVGTTALRRSIRAWTGNEPQFVEYTRAEFDTLVRRRNPLVEALATDGIPLTTSSRTLLRSTV